MEYKLDYYGYVYQWTNTVTMMKYIGSHYGDVNDAYTGSGKWFKPAYNKSPEDFELSILEHVDIDCKTTLLKREQHYLDAVDNIQADIGYYNLNNYALGGGSHITSAHIKKRADTLRQKHAQNGLSDAERLSYKKKIETRLARVSQEGFTLAEQLQHNSYGYRVSVVTPDGIAFEFNSYSQASRTLGIDVGYGAKVCKKKDSFRGYKIEILSTPTVRCSKYK